MTKKPVKKGWAAPKVKLEDRVLAIAEQATDTQHRLSNLAARVDGAWGKITTLANKLDMFGAGAAVDAAVALHRSTEVRPEKPFCVIANTARYIQGGAQGRTWCATRKIAEAHAESLMRNHPGMYDEMFVVEVVSKVSKKQPELEVTRY